MKSIVFYKKDKSVIIVHPARTSIFYGNEEKMLNRLYECNPELKELDYDWIDIKDLPQSREKRNQWKGEKGKGVFIEENLENNNLEGEIK